MWEGAADELSARQYVADPVGGAAGAEAGQGGKERERGDDSAQHRGGGGEAGCVAAACDEQKCGPDHVREAWRAAVLERPFAKVWLKQFEVEQAGEAVASAEEEADRQLQSEHCQKPPRAGRDGQQSDRADDSLVCARCTRVDHVRVPVRVGGTLIALHKVKY